MKPVRDIFFSLNLSTQIKKNLLLLEFLQKNWEKIVEKEFSPKTFPTLIQEETLWIEVPNHYVLQNLSGKTLVLLEKIKEVLPEKLKNSIKNLRFKINPSLETLSHKKTLKTIPSNSQNLKIFLRFCEEIRDPEIKKVFVKMFKSYVKLKKF
ncbi:MAG: DciA family protein [Thermodesulfobacterium sp.]|nr:DciA family protein [Thermodesulfobacterium sp.]